MCPFRRAGGGTSFLRGKHFSGGSEINACQVDNKQGATALFMHCIIIIIHEEEVNEGHRFYHPAM